MDDIDIGYAMAEKRLKPKIEALEKELQAAKERSRVLMLENEKLKDQLAKIALERMMGKKGGQG